MASGTDDIAMHSIASGNESGQQALIASLRDPGRYPHPARHVQLLETHISWVLLAGRYAYKIKKAVDFGFLDFTTLDARKFYCEEEIRLNRRFAPHLYLDVVAIGGSPQQPEWGAEPAIEYAVRMHRFATAKLMDSLLAHGRMTPAHIDSLAGTISRFHLSLPPAAAESIYGSSEAIRGPMRQNFAQLSPLLDDDQETLAALRRHSNDEYSICAPLFMQRKQQGWIRECHGDLHLGNIVLIRGEPVPFDGIEFNPGFRWIDVMNEVAFLVMDLMHRDRTDLAFRFLNGYLEVTGDYQGIGVLRFYLAYRAIVRAKIFAMRARQADTSPRDAEQEMAACHAYLALAANSLSRLRPALIITHGLPGCGKTTVAQVALERLQAIRIRSDVERKRLYGLAPLETSRSLPGKEMYSTAATERTYARLHDLARGLLDVGFTVIVDAAFLKHAERERFRRLAEEMAVPFVILSVQASEATLRSRIEQRMVQVKDASEADLAVLAMLQAVHEPIAEEERAGTVEFVNEGGVGTIASNPAWERLEKNLLDCQDARSAKESKSC